MLVLRCSGGSANFILFALEANNLSKKKTYWRLCGSSETRFLVLSEAISDHFLKAYESFYLMPFPESYPE